MEQQPENGEKPRFGVDSKKGANDDPFTMATNGAVCGGLGRRRVDPSWFEVNRSNGC